MSVSIDLKPLETKFRSVFGQPKKEPIQSVEEQFSKLEQKKRELTVQEEEIHAMEKKLVEDEKYLDERIVEHAENVVALDKQAEFFYGRFDELTKALETEQKAREVFSTDSEKISGFFKELLGRTSTLEDDLGKIRGLGTKFEKMESGFDKLSKQINNLEEEIASMADGLESLAPLTTKPVAKPAQKMGRGLKGVKEDEPEDVAQGENVPAGRW